MAPKRRWWHGRRYETQRDADLRALSERIAALQVWASRITATIALEEACQLEPRSSFAAELTRLHTAIDALEVELARLID